MKLIDADRAASIENLDQYSDLAAALGDVQTVRDILSDAPTIDAVPVVRCKDCIHLGFCGEATNLEVMGFYGFCSRGQRKIETVLTKNDGKDESLERENEC